MSQALAHQLGFKTRKINIGIQKIDNTILEIYKIVLSTLSILDKDSKEKFFKEILLLADIKSNIVLKMPFLNMSNINIDF